MEPTARPDGRYVTWQGRVYEGSVDGPRTVVLLSDQAEPGFTVDPLTGGYIRTVPSDEAQIWFLRTTCRWRGAPFVVMASVGDELVLRYTGGSSQEVQELGLTELERGVYQTTVPASEVTELQQVRTTG
jgi:hypothetical protein